MSSKQSTIDFLTEQIADAGDIRSRKMFGEYAIYCNEKVVALVCDDRLFVKPTDMGHQFIKEITKAPPYPGAKNYFQISADFWDDKEYLSEIIKLTADSLPTPKPKKK